MAETDRAGAVYLALDVEHKRKLKVYAAMQGKSMVEVVSEWIDERCGEGRRAAEEGREA